MVEQLCELADPQLRIILRAIEAPLLECLVDRMQVKLMLQKAVLIQEVPMLLVSSGIVIQKSRLSEQDSRQLKEAVTVLAQIPQRCMQCQYLECRTIIMESEIARQRDIERHFPVLFRNLQEPLDRITFAAKAMDQQQFLPVFL